MKNLSTSQTVHIFQAFIEFHFCRIIIIVIFIESILCIFIQSWKCWFNQNHLTKAACTTYDRPTLTLDFAHKTQLVCLIKQPLNKNGELLPLKLGETGGGGSIKMSRVIFLSIFELNVSTKAFKTHDIFTRCSSF